jgi:hypothetical protein
MIWPAGVKMLTQVIGAALIVGAVTAQSPRLDIYPGATTPDWARRAVAAQRAKGGGAGQEASVDVYVTTDPFEKVRDFYRAKATEFEGPKSLRTGPASEGLQIAFFSLDGGKTIATSKWWMKIQRPTYEGAEMVVRNGKLTAEFKNRHDVTSIEIARRK